MADCEKSYLLRGRIQIDNTDLGGVRSSGKVDRRSQNKIPIVAAASLHEAGHPLHTRITAVKGFSSDVTADWAKSHLALGRQVLSDGFA